MNKLSSRFLKDILLHIFTVISSGLPPEGPLENISGIAPGLFCNIPSGGLEIFQSLFGISEIPQGVVFLGIQQIFCFINFS